MCLLCLCVWNCISCLYFIYSNLKPHFFSLCLDIIYEDRYLNDLTRFAIYLTQFLLHSMFLFIIFQSIVDELMRQKSGEGPVSPRCSKRGSLTYLRRDGSSQLITPSSSSDTLSSTVSEHINIRRARQACHFFYIEWFLVVCIFNQYKQFCYTLYKLTIGYKIGDKLTNNYLRYISPKVLFKKCVCVFSTMNLKYWQR